MPLSRYLVIYPALEHPGHSLVHSTRSGATLLLSDSVLARAAAGDLEPSEQELLLRQGVVVTDLAEERRAMMGVLDDIARRRTRFNAALIMSLTCNMACRYCYEGGDRQNTLLSADTARQAVAYLTERSFDQGLDLCVTFHGGEPLLSLPLIKEVATALQQAAMEQGLRFHCVLVTNGTLLTRALVEELLPLGLAGAKVTLDGPRQLHDYSRPFRSGAGTFDLIMENLCQVADILPLDLGGNFTAATWRDFPQLLDDLLAAGLTPQRLANVVFSPVVESAHPVPDFHDGALSASEPWVMEASIALRQEILKRGFRTPRLTMSACMVSSLHDLVINHDGAIFKCPAFLAWPELSVGDVWQGVTDATETHDLHSWQCDECLDCPYLPLCFGGCRYVNRMRTGSIAGLDCKKDFFDAALQEYLRQELTYGITLPRRHSTL